jgi:TolB protein
MHHQLTLPKLSFHRWWLIGLLIFLLAGMVFVPEAGAQGAEPLSQASSSTGTIVFQTSSGGPIYAINADGTNLRYLTTGLDPALSPDGQRVAFTRWETSQDGALGSLWVIKIDGSGEWVIHENVYNPRTPVWSADGTQIAISMQHGGRAQPERTCGDQPPPRGAYDISVQVEDRKIVKFCYILPADPHWGLRVVNVATGAFEDQAGDLYSLSPVWDPLNPARLVYDGENGLVNLDLNQQTTATLTGDVNDHSPVFSPDGSKIAVSYRQDDHWEIHVMNADGSGRVRLTQTSYQAWVEQELKGEQVRSYNNTSPVWSPDSTQLAFLTDRTGQWEIWVMNADGSNQQPLFPAEVLAGITLQYNGADEQMITWQ